MNRLALYTNSYMDGLREIGDPLADQAVEVLIQSPELITEINSWRSIPESLPANFPVEVKDYFDFFTNANEDIPLGILEQGQEFFDKKGDMYLAMLGLFSLPYCYAFADGAEVLVRSKRILSNIGERLGETAVFLLDLFKPGAFFEDKTSYLTVAKVRLIHAFSRYYIVKYSNDWNKAFGIPINQEDMMGTNLAFSLIVLRGLRKLRKSPSAKEIKAVLDYWNWVGYLMGIDVSFWPKTSKEAYELEKLIRQRHLKASNAGKKLITALKSYYKNNIPDPIIAKQIDSLLFFFLGKQAGQALGLKPSPIIQGDVLGLFFTFSGLRDFGSKKNYSAIASQFKKNQLEQFGRLLEIKLPEIKRP